LSRFDQTVFHILSAIAGAILVFIGSGYVAATIPGCIIIIYLIQVYYLRTSRQLRLLDIEAKAPLFSQFLETLGGVACIRSYGWTEQYLERNAEIINHSQKPYYLMWCIQRWLTLVLDLFVAGLAILLVAIVTNVHNGSTSYLGVALLNVVSFSMTVQLLVAEWTQLETAIGAVNRVRAYASKTISEHLAGETGVVPEDWPSKGEITFTNVTASYSSSSEPVLSNIELAIRAGEKVALCGRTGR
jgi:ATP-binding cassette subfamily C (CFTR/MRP) protein 1